MAYKINISDLTPSQLSAACLVKISKFAIALKEHNGTVLELRNDDVVKELVKAARNTDDPKLDEIYNSIKQEISRHINSPRFTKHNIHFDQIYSGSNPSQTPDWATQETHR